MSDFDVHGSKKKKRRFLEFLEFLGFLGNLVKKCFMGS